MIIIDQESPAPRKLENSPFDFGIIPISPVEPIDKLLADIRAKGIDIAFSSPDRLKPFGLSSSGSNPTTLDSNQLTVTELNSGNYTVEMWTNISQARRGLTLREALNMIRHDPGVLQRFPHMILPGTKFIESHQPKIPAVAVIDVIDKTTGFFATYSSLETQVRIGYRWSDLSSPSGSIIGVKLPSTPLA